MKNRRVVLASRPAAGVPTPANFKLVEQDVPEIGDGEVLLENMVFAIDPAVRGMLDDVKSYLPPVAIGGLIPTMVLGRVAKSRNAACKEGDYGRGFIGWEEYSVLNPSSVGFENVKIDPSLPLTAYMGAIGWSGITAYVGLHKYGEMKAGDTVVVSAAAGAVGSVAGQIAKLRQCRAVGIVGAQDKADIITKQLGMHAAVNYKAAPDLSAAIKAACPSGIDLYFDNVGGKVLDTILPLMSDHGRIAVCGMIANYNNQTDPYKLSNLWQVLVHRITMRGFLAYEAMDMLKEAEHQLAEWVRGGQLIATENVTTGLENAPAAFIRLMSGETSGKTIVRLSDKISTVT